MKKLPKKLGGHGKHSRSRVYKAKSGLMFISRKGNTIYLFTLSILTREQR